MLSFASQNHSNSPEYMIHDYMLYNGSLQAVYSVLLPLIYFLFTISTTSPNSEECRKYDIPINVTIPIVIPLAIWSHILGILFTTAKTIPHIARQVNNVGAKSFICIT